MSNLTRAEANNNHAVSSACWLTGSGRNARMARTFRSATSLDQVVARQIGQDTTFPSLEVATEDFSGLQGACDPGYSCAYMNTLSWRSPTSPLPMEINPRVVFERLFGGGATAEERLARMSTDRSILDFVAGDLKDLSSRTWRTRPRALSEYLDHVREIERRIQRAEAQAQTRPDVPPEPVGVPESYDEHVALMFDLLALAYQADLTRVFTFMMAREVSQRTYPALGVGEPHHAVSHHGNRAESIVKHTKVNLYHMGLFAKFIERLRSTPDGDGSLLDHSLIVYGSGMSDGNGHTGGPLPLAIVGGGSGRVRGNRHIRTAQEHTDGQRAVEPVAEVRSGPGHVWRQHRNGGTVTTRIRAGVVIGLLALTTWTAAQSNARLAEVVRAGDATKAMELLKQGTSGHAEEADGTTALHWAARLDDVETGACSAGFGCAGARCESLWRYSFGAGRDQRQRADGGITAERGRRSERCFR